jgi:hypothetical protein
VVGPVSDEALERAIIQDHIGFWNN